MKITKKEIQEIVDDDSELIGKNNVPKHGSNLETRSNNTTDYNTQISHQPYRYDTLGRFGFNLYPFFEGKEDEIDSLLEELSSFLFEKYKEMLEYYYRNPNKIKPDYRMIKDQDYETSNKKYGFETAKEVLNIIKPHLEKSINNIDENKFIDEKILNNKEKRDITTKKVDSEIVNDNIKKIAGLINKKLSKEEKNNLINLLEVE